MGQCIVHPPTFTQDMFPLIGADGGGARGGRLPLEAKIDGPPPREKTGPPSPRRTGPPLKNLSIFGAELKQNL